MTGRGAILCGLEGAVANLDGQPVLLEVGETPPNDQQGIVLAGIDSDGVGRHTKVTANGSLATGSVHAGREVWADLFEPSVAATSYFLLIDLDSPTAPHVPGTIARICSGEAQLVKSATAASWEADIGVVLAIDGTDATVAWLGFLSTHAEDTGRALGVASYRSLSECLDLEQSGGDLVHIWAGNVETGIVAINTSAGTVDDVKGVARTAAPGDVVVRAVLNSGSGTAAVSYTISYFVDP